MAITEHSFNFLGISWRVGLDQSAQEVVWAECNGEEYQAGEHDYVAIRKRSPYTTEYQIKPVHILDALYDTALEADPK